MKDIFLSMCKIKSYKECLHLFLILAAGCFFLAVLAPGLEAATFNDAASGNWNDGATWGNASPGVEGTDYPGAGDDVTIDSHTVTLAADAACDDITISSGGTFTESSYTITVSGNWNATGGTISYGTGTLKMTGSGKTLTYQGSWNTAQIYNLTIGTGASVTCVKGAGAFPMVIINDIIIQDNATFSPIGLLFWQAADGSATMGDLTLGSGATLNIAGVTFLRVVNDASPHISTAGTISGTGHFEYLVDTGSTAAPVTARVYDCDLAVGSLELTGAGVLGGGSSLDIGAHTLYIREENQNFSWFGALDNSVNNIPVTAGAVVVGRPGWADYAAKLTCGSEAWDVNGDVTINASDASNTNELDAGSSTWNVSGNWANSDVFTEDTSTITFDGISDQTITSNSQSFYNLTLNNAGASGNDDILLADALDVNGAVTITDGDLDTTTSNYAVTVDGNLTINTNGSFTANGSTITCGGDWDSSAGTFNYGTSTLKMIGTSNTLAYPNGMWDNAFYNLTIDTNANITLTNGSFGSVVNNLTLNSGASFTLDKSFLVLGNRVPPWTSGGDLVLASDATLTMNDDISFIRYVTDSSNHISTGGTITGTGYFEYVVDTGSTAAPVTARVYGCNVVVASKDEAAIGLLGGGTSLNLGSKTLYVGDYSQNFASYGTFDTNNIPITAGALQIGKFSTLYGKLICGSSTIDINGNVAILASNASGTNEIDADTSSWTVAGDWTNNDTFTCDTSTIDFDASSGTQTLTSGGTGTGKKFYNLNHSGAGTLSISTNDAQVDSNGGIDNSGGIISEATGNLIYPATSALLTDSSGNEKASFVIGTDDIYVRVVDEDENLDATAADTLTGVTVTGGTNGDSETLTLIETGNTTEIFMSSRIATAGYDGSSQANDGTLELSANEAITVTYTDNEDGTDNAATDTATAALAIANFLVSVDSPQVAGTAFTYTITAREADGTTDTDYNGTANITFAYVTPSSGTKTLSTVSTSSFTNGIAAITDTYNDAGVITITATDASDTAITGISNNITFVPDSFTLSASKSTIAVNEPFTLTITAKNTVGDTTANYQGNAALSINYITPSTNQSGNLSTSALAASNWSSGIAALSSFTYNKFGIITITCTDPTDTTQDGTSSQLTFLPLELEVTQASPSGGRDFYYAGEEIVTTVTAKDYNGNAVSNYASTVGFSGTEYLDLPDNYSFASSDSGTHIFSGISASEKGTTSITATDTTYSAATGTSSNFTVKEGTIIVRDTSGPVGTLPVTADLIDSDGNDIANDSSTRFTVTLSESRADNTASTSATDNMVTFAEGNAEIEITDSESEVVTVTPVPEFDYLNAIAGKVTFGGAGAPRFDSGIRVLWWRELRGDE